MSIHQKVDRKGDRSKKKPHGHLKLHVFCQSLVPQDGLEPPTHYLRSNCSTS